MRDLSFVPLSSVHRTGSRILWDDWGVPHVFADTLPRLFFAFGWAQMENHASVLLGLYGRARGRASEYWGEAHWDWDKYITIMDVYRRAGRWRRAQSAEFGACLDAFASGINAYAVKHRKRIGRDLSQVLPVSSVDILAHVQTIVHMQFLAAPALGKGQTRPEPLAGSNAWAIRSNSDRSNVLLGNPHLLWRDQDTFFEAHLTAGTFEFYGATLVGFPVPIMGFNPHLGWAHTVNPVDSVDLYELRLQGSGYRMDGRPHEFRTSDHIIKVRSTAGGYRDHTVRVRKSVHGPVVFESEKTARAIRVPGLGTSGICSQWWSMANATGLPEFERALKRLQIPMFDVVSAGRDGHVFHLFGGRVPKRPLGQWDWSTVVPGDTSATLWSHTHAYDELPKTVDPPSGWLQNANDCPWSDTVPAVNCKDTYPSYFPKTPPSFRARRSLRMLQESAHLSFNDVLSCKNSSRSELADCIVPDLIKAAEATECPSIRQAAAVLSHWDRETNKRSRGGVLFHAYIHEACRRKPQFLKALAQCYAVESLPTLLCVTDAMEMRQHLEAAADATRNAFGSLDVPWGEAFRLRRDALDLPAAGGPSTLGIFRVLEFSADADGKFKVEGGDSFVFAVEFSPNKTRARVLLSYGNASEMDSRHRTDQLALFAKGAWRKPSLTPKQIAANLDHVEMLIT